MKSLRVSFVAIAAVLLVSGCVHPHAQPVSTPTPMPPVPTATPPIVSIAPTPAPAYVEITPAPQVIEVTPSQVETPRSHRAPQRYTGGRIVGSRYRVRRGDNLWEISKRAYGNPLRWFHVYRANRSHIRNPRLIYPGQVIHLPR